MWGQPPRLSTDANGNTVLVGPNGVPISFAGPAYLFANLPDPASNAGMSARVTDVGPTSFGSVWQCDGSAWRPLNGVMLLQKSSVPTGTIASAVTSGTYLQSGTTLVVTATGHGLTAASNGFSMKALFTTGAAVSGFYPFTYIDANSFSLLMPTTGTPSGDVTLEGIGVSRTLATIAIPAGVLGSTGSIEIDASFSLKSNGNNKTLTTLFNGVLTLRDGNFTTNEYVGQLMGMHNITAASQKRKFTLYGTGLGGGAGPSAISTVDTSVATSITISGTVNAVDDYIQLESYTAKLVR
jgi:hypothetical protein